MNFSPERYLSTFRETSFDRAKGESLIGDIRHQVLNFDLLSQDLGTYFRGGENLSSADALVVMGEEILLLEFKNQKLSSIDSERIQRKAFDSLYLLSFLKGMEEKSREEMKDKVSFLVLYRENDIPSVSAYREKVSRLAGKKEKPLPFGLDKLRPLYKEIYAMTAEDFLSSPLFRHMESE